MPDDGNVAFLSFVIIFEFNMWQYMTYGENVVFLSFVLIFELCGNICTYFVLISVATLHFSEVPLRLQK